MGEPLTWITFSGMENADHLVRHSLLALLSSGKPDLSSGHVRTHDPASSHAFALAKAAGKRQEQTHAAHGFIIDLGFWVEAARCWSFPRSPLHCLLDVALLGSKTGC